MKILPLLIAALLYAGSTARAQERPCDTPEGKAFDFWLGEWELSWPGGQGGTPEGETGRGTNVITRILDDCIIQENFRSEAGYNGMSVSTLHRRTGKWHQTWVDGQGGYIAFTGDFRGGEMDLRTDPYTNPSGATQINRMLWTNITNDLLEWHWQSSLDDGATWEDMWVIRYAKKR